MYLQICKPDCKAQKVQEPYCICTVLQTILFLPLKYLTVREIAFKEIAF